MKFPFQTNKLQTDILLSLIIAITLQVVAAFDESKFDDDDIYIEVLPYASLASSITVPGTKWCGPGNTSSSYNDLGTQLETDKCCRQHDHCDTILEPGSIYQGLNNTDWFPILKCSCEQKFVKCLRAANNMISHTVGYVYYRARSLCMAKGHPIIQCKQYQNSTFGQRCIRYNAKRNKRKIWQFYEMPFYAQGTRK